MNQSKYFYLSTIRQGTSVQDSIKANFTFSVLADDEVESLTKNEATTVIFWSFPLL